MDRLSDRLAEAENDIDALRSALAGIMRAAELPERARDSVMRLAGSVSDRLQSAGDQVQVTQGRLDECRSSLRELRDQARAWIRGIAVLLTLVLVWFGIGQASLFYLGWTAATKGAE